MRNKTLIHYYQYCLTSHFQWTQVETFGLQFIMEARLQSYTELVILKQMRNKTLIHNYQYCLTSHFQWTQVETFGSQSIMEARRQSYPEFVIIFFEK
jgi:hypothetical protein